MYSTANSHTVARQQLGVTYLTVARKQLGEVDACVY